VFGLVATDPLQGTELPDIAFGALANGQGCGGVRVERADTWRDRLLQALNSLAPILVEIEVT